MLIGLGFASLKECARCAPKSQAKPTATAVITDSITLRSQPNKTNTPKTDSTTHAISAATTMEDKIRRVKTSRTASAKSVESAALEKAPKSKS